ncbi:hypothetical protein [Streptomyces tauricus]|uniref:hypothetical protein n=1 Tax=Streptomyces tauricus TaxID=68274 RepID=UPI00380E9452
MKLQPGIAAERYLLKVLDRFIVGNARGDGPAGLARRARTGTPEADRTDIIDLSGPPGNGAGNWHE